MPTRTRNAVILWLLIYTFFAIIAGLLYHHWFWKPYSGKQAVVVRFYSGQSLGHLRRELQQQGIAPSGFVFRLYLRLVTQGKHLKAGEYEFEPGMTLQDFLRRVEHGRVKIRRFAVIPGWRLSELLHYLKKDKAFEPQKLTLAVLQQALNSKQTQFEGLFFPATYRYHWGCSPTAILQKSYEKMQSTLQAQWQSRSPNLVYKNAYQALIAASLIEKETHAKSERPMVARVILNRLHKNMRLQIDPTVIYALKDPGVRVVTRRMLKIDSPYNTYRRKGLPPTPICLPSESSIHAALHPARTKALYYVATGDGIHHHFSNSYRQHLVYVRHYRRRMKEQEKQTLLGFPMTLHQLEQYWQSHCEAVDYWLPSLAGLLTTTGVDDWLLFPVNQSTHCERFRRSRSKHKSMYHGRKKRTSHHR